MKSPCPQRIRPVPSTGSQVEDRSPRYQCAIQQLHHETGCTRLYTGVFSYNQSYNPSEPVDSSAQQRHVIFPAPRLHPEIRFHCVMIILLLELVAV
jgi:hypothetical protein